jgi:hypothetical protein
MDAEAFRAANARMTEYGYKFSYEFVDNMQEDIYETLRNWFKANGCPEMVIDALDNAIMLARYANAIKNKALSEMDASELLMMVPIVSEQIMQLGGHFTGMGGEGNPRENPLIWQPEKQEDCDEK